MRSAVRTVIRSRSGKLARPPAGFSPSRRAISFFEKRSACSCRIRSRAVVALIVDPRSGRPCARRRR
jgi:hypothetical protein